METSRLHEDDDDDQDYSVSLLEQALFEEADYKHEREDAYGGLYGVMIGGMAVPTIYDLAVQYLDAADCLVASVRNQDVEDYTLANPILFLYRHSIETLLKSCLPNAPRNHNLHALMALYSADVRLKYSCGVPGWVSARVKEIGDVDPGSTAFRYAQLSVDDKTHVYLANIQTVVRALHSALNDAPRFRTDLPIFRG